jgi:putative ABC transport system permease protein
MKLVLRQGLGLASAGLVIGVAGALALTRVVKGMLFGLTPVDPFTFITCSLVFAVVALLAAYVPARRATKLDPLVALRCE